MTSAAVTVVPMPASPGPPGRSGRWRARPTPRRGGGASGSCDVDRGGPAKLGRGLPAPPSRSRCDGAHGEGRCRTASGVAPHPVGDDEEAGLEVHQVGVLVLLPPPPDVGDAPSLQGNGGKGGHERRGWYPRPPARVNDRLLPDFPLHSPSIWPATAVQAWAAVPLPRRGAPPPLPGRRERPRRRTGRGDERPGVLQGGRGHGLAGQHPGHLPAPLGLALEPHHRGRGAPARTRFSTRACRSAKAATCGRCVTQMTWRSPRRRRAPGPRPRRPPRRCRRRPRRRRRSGPGRPSTGRASPRAARGRAHRPTRPARAGAAARPGWAR